MKTKLVYIRISCCLIFLCCLQQGFSQADFEINMLGPSSPPAEPITDYATTDVSYSFTIGADSVTGLVQYLVSPILPATSGLTVTAPGGFVDPLDPTQYITLSLTGPATAESYSFTVEAIDQADPAHFISQQFTFNVTEPTPVAVVMVLDRSGSMGSQVPGSVPPTTRMEMLQTTASLFVDKLDVFSPSVDKQLALTYFNSGVDVAPAPIAPNLTPVDGNANTFTNDIETTLVAGGSTAIGDALVEGGKNKLLAGAPDYRKAILLFTDGEQNTGKQINADGTEADGIALNNPPDNDIQIITIGFAGAALGATAVNLQNVALNNQGVAMAPLSFSIGPGTDVSPMGDMDVFFDQALESFLSDGSPQTVNVIKGTMPAQIPDVQTFEINQGIEKIVFELLTLDREPFFTIEKNGTQLNESNTNLEFVRGTNSLLAIVDLSENPSGIVSEGEWKISIGSGTGGGKPYQIKAQVDDHRLDYTFEVSADEYKVEDILELEANLTYDRAPIEDAVISALVLKPGEDLGDLLARSEVKFDPSTGTDVSSVGYQKLLALIADNPALVDSLGLKENSIDLVHDGNGIYKAQFSDTGVSGAYQIVGRIAGTTTSGDVYQRVVRRTIYLRFGDPDPESSTWTYTRTGNNTIQLTYIPMYTVGTDLRFVGPGFAKGISVTGADVSNIATVDNGDGSYTIDIQLANSNTDPDIEVSISGVEVFKGKATEFDNAGGVLDDFEDWLQNTFGISLWVFLIILLLILIIIWIIKKVIK